MSRKSQITQSRADRASAWISYRLFIIGVLRRALPIAHGPQFRGFEDPKIIDGHAGRTEARWPVARITLRQGRARGLCMRTRARPRRDANAA
jgi:hypothetical protein